MAKLKVGDTVSTKDDFLWYVVSSENASGRRKIVRRSNRWETYDDYEEDTSEFADRWEGNDTHIAYVKLEDVTLVNSY